MNEHDPVDSFLGVDKKKQIFDLWYEVNFIRNILNTIIRMNPQLMDCINQQNIEECRANAQVAVIQKFPMCNIEFQKTEPK